MKNKSLFFLGLLTVLVTGCFGNTKPSTKSDFSSDTKTSDSSGSSSSALEKTATIDIYASNDIHGIVSL